MADTRTAVSVPGTPLLVPALTGAQPPAGCDRLRAAVTEAVAQLADSTAPLWLVGPATTAPGPPVAPSASATGPATGEAVPDLLPGVSAHRPGDVTGLAGYGHQIAESRAAALLPQGSHGSNQLGGSEGQPRSPALVSQGSAPVEQPYGAAAQLIHTVTPIELQVAQWVLQQAGVHRPLGVLSLAVDCPPETHDALADYLADVDLVVVADGSACLGPKPPRGLHDTAQSTHDDLSAALTAGESAGLRKLTAEQAADQWIAGYHPWQVLAGWADRHQTTHQTTHQTQQQPPRTTAQVTFNEAPYGVGYVVAVWQKTAVVGG